MRAIWIPVFCILACVPALADFAAGLRAYEKHDFAGAIKEWRPLADEGNSAAQFNLGLLYYEGEGVPQNYGEAAKWFERAAEQGYASAQYNLGAMYGVGHGVKRDYSKAYLWLSLCAAAGNPKCAAQRDLVAKKLSASKLAAAQQTAREWKPKK
jgi:uncharacterized protein